MSANGKQVVDGLRPPALDELALVGASRQRVVLLERLAFHGQRTYRARHVPRGSRGASLSIATEAATNAVRHARRCTIVVRRTDAPELKVADDGRGICRRRPQWHRTPFPAGRS